MRRSSHPGHFVWKSVLWQTVQDNRNTDKGKKKKWRSRSAMVWISKSYVSSYLLPSYYIHQVVHAAHH